MSALRKQPGEPVVDRDVLSAKVQAANDKAAKVEKAKAESLDERIDQTEKRIAARRMILAARTSDVTGKVKGTLASPMLVLVAAGAGFIFAQFRKRRGKDDDARDKREVVMKPSVFATLTDALTLATTLLAMMPLIRSKAKEGVQQATGDVPPS